VDLAASAPTAGLPGGDASRPPGGSPVPRRLSAVRVRPRWCARGEQRHAGAGPPAAERAGAANSGGASPPAARRVTADGRDNAGVRGRDGGRGRRRGGAVSAEVHASGRGRGAGW
jgi:hypothetical protein